MKNLSTVEKIAKKVLTAKTHKTAATWRNKINNLSDEDAKRCKILISTHGDRSMIGYGAIYPNSYLIGGDYRG